LFCDISSLNGNVVRLVDHVPPKLGRHGSIPCQVIPMTC